MKFKKEVQDLFKKAGWYEGRSIRQKFDAIPRFSEFPEFLKEFLYEYGDVELETYKENQNDPTAILDFKALLKGYFKISEYLDKPSSYGNITTFPIAYYDLDVTVMECDAEGKIYMTGDFPALISTNFKEGIEKIIMEDYSNTLQWNPKKKIWVEEY